MHRWTVNEDKVIKERYSTMPKDVLQRLFPNRTWDAITQRAKKFGLKKEVASWLRQKTELNLTDFEMGYLVGMIDGEGSITLVLDHRRKTGSYYRPSIYIANTNMEIINYVKKLLGDFGRIGFLDKRKKRIVYGITINRFHNAYVVLSKVTPFLKGKKKQAELMLEFINMRKRWTREIIRDEKGRIVRTRGWKTTKREQEIYKEIHSLNH